MDSILIIDDDEIDRFLIKKALLEERDTLELFELQEGSQAVLVIKDKKPLATLLDVRMPGLDGFDVLKMIRRDSDIGNHPVFMVSGSADPSDMKMAEEAGANGYLTKPASLSGYGVIAKTIHENVFGIL